MRYRVYVDVVAIGLKALLIFAPKATQTPHSETHSMPGVKDKCEADIRRNVYKDGTHPPSECLEK